MDEKRMNYYLDLVPPEIRDAAAGLHDDKHWAVFIALLENGDTRFSELKKEFGLESTQMIRLLRDLGRAGLVAQYTDDLREIESRARSFYKVTTIGSNFIESLMDKFLPQAPGTNEYGVSGTPVALSSSYGQVTQQGKYASTETPPQYVADNFSSTEQEDLRYIH